MKLLHSSRLRLALTTVVISGLVLGAFAAAAWWKIRDARLATVDREMESPGIRLSLAARSDLSLTRAESMLDEQFGKERAGGWRVSITSWDGRESRSDNWPVGLNPDSFLPSAETMPYDFGMPGGGRPDGPGGPRREPFGEMEDEDFGPGPERGPGPGPGPGPRFREGRDDAPGPPGPLLFRPVFGTGTAEGKLWRVGTFGHGRSGTVIVLAVDMERFAPDLRQTGRALLLALPGALLLVAAGAWLAARRSFAPVQTLASSMQALSFRQANARLDASGADTEFSGIIAAYNEMLDRLERSYQQAMRFSADASHELKTPLAVMRATVEQGLRRCPDGSETQRSYAGLLDELDQLQAIIESLLLLSRADAGVLATSRESLELSDWLAPLVEDAGLMAEERGITVQSALQHGITVRADPVLLSRAVHNLMRNAVAYNEDGGSVRCSLERTGQMAVLEIANTGTPLSEEDRERIFARFFRGANAGGTGGGKGMGIGLSLAREIFRAHGGDLGLQPSATAGDAVTVFRATIPCAAEAGSDG